MLENDTSAQADDGGAGASGAAGGGNQADTDAAAAAAANAGNEGEGGAGESEDDDLSSLGLDPTDKRGLKTRFTTVTAERDSFKTIAEQAKEAARAAELEAARWRGVAEGKGGGQQHTQQQQQVVDPNPEPDPNDKTKYRLGADDPLFIKDLAKFEIKREAAAEQAERERKQHAQADYTTRRDRYMATRDAAAANPDTPNAAKQLGEMPVQFTDEIVQSKHGALIAEHFATTGKAEFDALLKEHVTFDAQGGSRWKSAASATAFARKIGALESSLPGVFASRKATKAPTPPEKVTGGGGGSVTKDPSKMSTEEYRAWRAGGGG